MTTDLFGSGLRWPYRVAPSGRLQTKSGAERLLDSVEQVIDTPKGVCPMDPQYGLDLDAYESIDSADQVAWDLADAIEYGEPRADRIEVELTKIDPGNGLIGTEVHITPIGSNVPLNRTFPLYVRSGS